MSTKIPEAALESVARSLAMSDALSRGEISDWANASPPEREWWMNRADDLLQAALPHLIGPFAAANTGPDVMAKAVALSDVIRAVPDEPVTRLIGLRALLAQHERLLTDEFFGPDQCSCGWAGDGFADHVASAVEATVADRSWQEVNRLKRELTRRRMSDAESAAFHLNYVPAEELERLRLDVRAIVDDPTVLAGTIRDRVRSAIAEPGDDRG